MSYGLDNYVNNKVSDPVLLFFDSFQLDIKKRKMWFPKVFISALDKIGMDVKKTIGRFLIYFLLVVVYACNQNTWLQLNVF